GSGEEIEHRKLFLGELLANVPLLFIRERATQGEQILEQVVDVPAARVVGLDQRLELGQEIGARWVGADQRVELLPNRRPKLLQFDVLARRLRESLRERLEVNGGEVD